MARRQRQPRRYPANIERQYADACSAAAAQEWRGLSERILSGYSKALGPRADASVDGTHRTIPGSLSGVLEGVGIEYGRRMERRGERLPMVPGRSAADYAAETVDGQLGAVIGIRPLDSEPWLNPAVDAWRGSNTALISGLAPRHMEDVDALVRQAWESGTRAETLAKQLQERLGITERRAALIARDQIGKLNGQLTMLRQQSYGVGAYIWATSMDERVRQVHADRDGRRFPWATPPPDGHPGMPIQCRCVAEPDLDDALEELERLGEEELPQRPPPEPVIE